MDSITKKCKKCGEIKFLSEYHKHRIGKYGVRSVCKDCRAIEKHRYYLAHTYQIYISKKNWLLKHPLKITEYNHARRDRKVGNGGVITEREWKELCDFYDNVCLCCGANNVRLELDHVIPLKLGGVNAIENAQPLCRSCNRRKNTKHIDYRK